MDNRRHLLAAPATQGVALLGPSGSGKNTVLRVILGIAVPRRGTVLLGDKVVSERGRILVRDLLSTAPARA